MASVNKVILIGHLGNDPILKSLGSNSVANFNIATSKKWTDKKTGELKEKTEWHRIVVWGKLAEIASKYLFKGSPVYLEGELQTRDWSDKEGGKHYTTEVVANEVVFLGQNKSVQKESEERESDDDPLAMTQRVFGPGVEQEDIPF